MFTQLHLYSKIVVDTGLNKQMFCNHCVLRSKLTRAEHHTLFATLEPICLLNASLYQKVSSFKSREPRKVIFLDLGKVERKKPSCYQSYSVLVCQFSSKPEVVLAFTRPSMCMVNGCFGIRNLLQV